MTVFTEGRSGWTSSHLSFETTRIGSDPGWIVVLHSLGESIGLVVWCASEDGYGFEPEADVVYGSVILDEIASFVRQMGKKRKGQTCTQPVSTP